jgi:hypothetical protein
MVVLSGTCLKLCPHCLAELVTMDHQHGLVYLPIILDNVYDDAMLVGELDDPQCALVPPHDAATVLERFDKHSGGGGPHLETFILGKLLVSLFVDAVIQLA